MLILKKLNINNEEGAKASIADANIISILGILNTCSDVAHGGWVVTCTEAAKCITMTIILPLMVNIGEINWVGMGDTEGSVRRAFLAGKTATIMIGWQEMTEMERFYLGLWLFSMQTFFFSISFFFFFLSFPTQNKY